jgi:NAD(P)-dependent dehydrogenase (short-subunit alcohol dehydrogenase family)
MADDDAQRRLRVKLQPGVNAGEEVDAQTGGDMDLLQRLFGLDDRVAVVTGGASGLGAAFSRGLAAAGATVVIADIDEESALANVADIRAAGGSAEHQLVDVTDVAGVHALAERLIDAHGRIDVLVNSAGAAHRSPIEQFSEEAYDRILALNLKGTYFVSQAIGRKMIAQRRGSIINIASIGGLIAYPDASAYLASKGGVVQTTRSFALEWINHGVRVNAIAPGLCETPLLRKVLAASGSTTTTDFIQQRMLGRPLIQPDDLIAAVIFLAGDGAAKVTGHILAVDDGYLAQ